MNNFEAKKKIVEAGNSFIFNNWHGVALVTKKEFLDALKWVCEDELDEKGRMTREIGLVVTEDAANRQRIMNDPKAAKMFCLTYDPKNVRGKIVKLERSYDKRLGILTLFEIENGKRWEGNVSLNCRDRV